MNIQYFPSLELLLDQKLTKIIPCFYECDKFGIKKLEEKEFFMKSKVGVCLIHGYVENYQISGSKPGVCLIHECILYLGDYGISRKLYVHISWVEDFSVSSTRLYRCIFRALRGFRLLWSVMSRYPFCVKRRDVCDANGNKLVAYVLQLPTAFGSTLSLQSQAWQGRFGPYLPVGSPKYPSAHSSHRLPFNQGETQQFTEHCQFLIPLTLVCLRRHANHIPFTMD